MTNNTIRSVYNFEQFMQVMTALAHKVAIKAVTKLENSELLVKAYGPGRFSEVNSGTYNFKFYAKHLSFSHHQNGKWSDLNSMSFDVEEKFYMTSNHSTKISFYSPEIHESNSWIVDLEKTKVVKEKLQEKIEAFIEQLMKEANIKPVQRFTLKKMQT
jgi:hypothetical protein